MSSRGNPSSPSQSNGTVFRSLLTGDNYTRIGDTTREMLPDELREYFQQSIEWDSVTGPYSFDEIDEEAVKRFLARG